MTSATTLTVAPLDIHDADAVEGAYRVHAAAMAHDVPDFPQPCRHRFEAGLRHPYAGYETHHFVAHLDERIVGELTVELPVLDNLDNAGIELTVDPAHRRRGVGRALWEHAVVVARAAGRRRVFADTVEALPDGPARHGAGSGFARAMGFTDALREVRRRQDVTALDRAELDRMLAAAWRRADGYSLVSWADAAPDDVVADVAYLDGRLVTDAPMGDLDWEPEKIDTERIRTSEAVRRARGTREYNMGARHDASGRLVALTSIAMEKSHRDHAWQNITLVDPDHRGHRLGLIVKIENLRYALAHEPELTHVDTWNAAVNEHMISINEAIGYRPVDAWVNWQRELDA